MTEGGPKEKKKKKNPLSDFDGLVGAAAKLKQRAEEEGRAVPDTPAIDSHIDNRKKQAGSPPSAFESEES